MVRPHADGGDRPARARGTMHERQCLVAAALILLLLALPPLARWWRGPPPAPPGPAPVTSGAR